MRYLATYDEGTCDDRVCAKVLGKPFGDELNEKDCRLAARHARAMAAVLRAAKAWHRGYHRHLSGSKAWAELQIRLDRAVARLEKVEKEVGRG